MTLVIGFDAPPARPQGYVRPSSGLAYRLDLEGETVFPITQDGQACFVIPGISLDDIHGVDSPVLVMDGETPSDWPMLREIIRAHAFRVCPWAVLWCAPGFLGSASWSGRAWRGEGIALLCIQGSSPPWILRTALHETWHLLETWIPADLLERLDAALAQGPDYGFSPATWTEKPKAYHGLASERRARAFEHMAMLHIEGVCPPGATWPHNSAWSILSRAWTGEIGILAMERREAALLAERQRVARRTVIAVSRNEEKEKRRIGHGQAA